MPIAVTAVLFIFWMVMAYREFQRGDMLLAAVFALVGVVLSAYRFQVARKRSRPSL